MLLNAQHLRFSYIPGETVLHDVSLKIDKGEILYILGRNGGGKTTLLSCLAGLLTPASGEIILEGKPLTSFNAAQRSRKIGLIPQMHTPVFAYSVREMVMMGRAPHLHWLESPSQIDQNIVEESMEQVGVYELRDRPYTEISGGERQLVMIARGLAQKCEILLMDEPTAHLDLSNQHRVLEIIQQLSRQGLSFIVSSHAPNDALTYADQVLLLSDGWVTDYGPPETTLTEPLLSYVYGIRTEVIYNHENGALTPRAVVPRRPTIISPESINDPRSLLSDLFERGKLDPQILILTGLSGAGKTTWCMRLAKLAEENALKVKGILSPGVYKGDQKIAIDARDIESGVSHRLAMLRERAAAELSTPRWQFDPETVSWANQVLKEIQFCDLLILDEIGPLELLRDEGLTAGLRLLDTENYRVACVVVRSSLVPKALQRWPEAMVVSGESRSMDQTEFNGG
ncbi:MAG: ATP-binding cassette domain-containing protein [Brevefilum sp.]